MPCHPTPYNAEEEDGGREGGDDVDEDEEGTERMAGQVADCRLQVAGHSLRAVSVGTGTSTSSPIVGRAY